MIHILFLYFQIKFIYDITLKSIPNISSLFTFPYENYEIPVIVISIEYIE